MAHVQRVIWIKFLSVVIVLLGLGETRVVDFGTWLLAVVPVYVLVIAAYCQQMRDTKRPQ